MNEAGAVLTGFYDYRLVALSVAIAVLAAYAALDLAGRVTLSRGKARFFWLTGGALAMGVGIWSMHYIGMEALRLPVRVYYDWPTVLVSMLAAIAASAVALLVVSRKKMGTTALCGGSVAMGTGIAAMHYIGMEAMRLPAMCHYSLKIVAFSVVLAIAISGVALFLGFKFRAETANWGWKRWASALIMGAAIPVMHYVGMWAASFTPMPLSAADLTHAIDISDLGIAAITLITLVMLGLVFVTSIVDRRLTHQALELDRRDRRYRQIVESAFDAFIGFDRSFLIEHWNAQAETTFGWTPEEAKGRPLGDFILLDRKISDTETTLRDLLRWDDSDGMQARVEVTAVHKEGYEFPAEMAISSVRSEQRSLFAAFVHDVTGRKLVELEREAAKRAAEAANRAKGEFLANMSHEIRTPLNGVIGMTELALQTELTKEQREYLKTVSYSAESLLSVINDILDFSKIEAGKVELEDVDFDLRESIETTLKTLALRAEEKNLELLCDVAPSIPEVFRGDMYRLRQIVVNLVGNAIKFTHEGEVALQIDSYGTEDGRCKLHFVVSDTGIGISSDKLDGVFESFSQADTSTTREYGGTGLGLTISRRLVEMMGGHIWVESQLGRGSQFHFTLELRLGTPGPVAKPDQVLSQALAGVRVLVVDDNRTNRRILEGLLTAWGMQPTLAPDAESALAILSKAGEKYRLILTDMHMPRMDGFEMIENIRAENRATTATIMMLSSGGHRGDTARCEQLGVAAYLLKPIRQAELREAIVRVLGAFEETEARSILTRTSLQTETDRDSALNILVAEDNEVNQKLARRLLEKRGHRVTMVANGRDAVEVLRRSRFDLTLMDVQMPEMDGIEATAALRDWELDTGLHQPIVAMTALVMKGDRERCLAAGMDGYLSKPLRSQDLDDVLEKYIAESRLSKASRVRNSAVNPFAQQDPVDARELLDRVGDDREFLSDLVAVFREDCPRQLALIEKGLSAQAPAEISRAAHSLKGALSNLAAPAATSLAAEVEHAGAAGEMAKAEAALGRLRDELERVLDSLSALSEEAVR